ncbi:putative carbonic anhydrase [Helianthus annuus]|nr:putative carbonic anhydrase [Helianthus annuus]
MGSEIDKAIASLKKLLSEKKELATTAAAKINQIIGDIQKPDIGPAFVGPDVRIMAGFANFKANKFLYVIHLTYIHYKRVVPRGPGVGINFPVIFYFHA